MVMGCVYMDFNKVDLSNTVIIFLPITEDTSYNWKVVQEKQNETYSTSAVIKRFNILKY